MQIVELNEAVYSDLKEKTYYLAILYLVSLSVILERMKMFPDT